MTRLENDDRRLSDRLWAGISWGIGIAILLCLWVTLAYLRLDRHESGPELHHVITVYLFIGFAGGAIVGLLMPIARRWWGAPIVGFFVAVIGFTSISAMDGHLDVTSILHLSLWMGPALGFGYWAIFRA